MFALAESGYIELPLEAGDGGQSHVGKYRSPGMEHISDRYLLELVHLYSQNYDRSVL